MEDEKEAHSAGDKLRAFVKERPLVALFATVVLLSVLVIVYWAVWADSSPAWTGFGTYDEEIAGQRAKTLWNWLELLIVPAALAVGAYWLNRSQKETELKIAEKARTAEREIAENRQKQATLEAYYDRMTELLLKHDLRESATDSEVRSIVRARTVAVVKSLDGERNRQLFAFLQASKLLEGHFPIIDLRGCDFNNVDLIGADLRSIRLDQANFSSANLFAANFTQADLTGANLSNSNLRLANLQNTMLMEAYLDFADLRESNLSGAVLAVAHLSMTLLSRANLSHSLLHGAILCGSLLLDANLKGAQLDHANLEDTNLEMADFSGANLKNARNWTIEQFDKVITLEGATMPDGVELKGKRSEGPTYEEWKAQYLAKGGEQENSQ